MADVCVYFCINTCLLHCCSSHQAFPLNASHFCLILVTVADQKIWETHRFSDSKFRRPIYTGHSVFVRSTAAQLSTTSECNYCGPRYLALRLAHLDMLGVCLITSILFPVPSMCLLLCISKCRLMMMILCNNSSLL